LLDVPIRWLQGAPPYRRPLLPEGCYGVRGRHLQPEGWGQHLQQGTREIPLRIFRAYFYFPVVCGL
jgi:hypothetical protein